MPSINTRSTAVHVFQKPRHEIAGGAIVEPAQRQQLNVRIQIAAQIEDNFLLEVLLKISRSELNPCLKQKCGDGREQNERHQFFRMILPNDDRR